MKQDFGKAKTTFESQNENAASVVKLCKVTAGSPRERRLTPLPGDLGGRHGRRDSSVPAKTDQSIHIHTPRPPEAGRDRPAGWHTRHGRDRAGSPQRDLHGNVAARVHRVGIDVPNAGLPALRTG